MSKQQREDVEKVLKYGDSTTVVATSTLELGIDIGAIDQIVQIGAPPSVASLQQRLGRSGRRGTDAILDLFVIEPPPDSERSLEDRLHVELVQSIATLELLTQRWYEPPVTQALHLSTLVQQILSLSVQGYGADENNIYEVLCTGRGAFTGVSRKMFEEVVDALLEGDYLYRMDGSSLLHLGDAGEKLTTGPYFLAAFSTPVEYKVISDERIVGTLPLTFGVDYGSLITLGARRWRIRHIDDDHRKIYVDPATGAMPPRFLGTMAPVHERVRKEMLHLLESQIVPRYLSDAAVVALDEARSTFRGEELDRVRVLPHGEDLLILPWTGDRALLTMALQLTAAGLKAWPVNLAVRVRKCGVGELYKRLDALQDEHRRPEDLARLRRKLTVHKHHRKLSPALLAADFASEFVDIEGATRAWEDVARHLPTKGS